MQDKFIKLFEFLTKVLVVFSVTILFISAIGFFVGDEAKNYSSLFRLGNEGMTYSTLSQLLFSSTIVTVLNYIFMSSKLFKNMLMLWRTVLLLLTIIVVITLFIICFNWFALDFVPAWIGFFISFGGFFIISTLVMVIKTKHENKRYDELLKSYKNKQKPVGGMNNEND